MRTRLLGFCILLSLLGGCVFAPWRRDVALPTDESFVRDQLVIHSDFDVPRKHRLFDELVAQRSDLTAKLKLPASDEPINVYLFNNLKRFRTYIRKHHPEFPERRAFFVENDTELVVYAYWGERVAEDLRHEVAHGYLHSVVPNLPLWLDEGLAEYFEVPRGRQGINTAHLDLLLPLYDRDRWTPNMKQLERLSMADDMTQLDYAEAWAWTHMLLESTPQRRMILRKHLSALRDDGIAPLISKSLAESEPDFSPQRELIRHLKSLAKRRYE